MGAEKQTAKKVGFRHLLFLLLSHTRSKKISPKHKKNLGMACHTPPLKKVKKQGEMPLPSASPIPLKNVEFRDGMGPRLGNGISPCFFAFLRGGV